MKFVSVGYIIRLLLPILFIKLISYYSTQVELQEWLELLLVQQFGILITESGINLSGPLLLSKFGKSKIIVKNVLALQLLAGFLGFCVTSFIFSFSEVDNLAYAVGFVQGLSITWLLRYELLFKKWFLHESIYRFVIYVAGGFVFFVYHDFSLILCVILVISILWLLWQYVDFLNNLSLTKIEDKNDFYILFFQGIGIKSGALFIYPGLLLYGKDFFDYSVLQILEMDKISQSVRGLYTPIVEYLFPKYIKNESNTSLKKNLFIGVALISSIFLFFAYPLVYRVLFGSDSVMNIGVRAIMSLIPLLYGVIHYNGTFGLLLKSKMNLYLLSFFLSIVLGILAIKSSNVLFFIIIPHLSLALFSLIFNYFTKIELKK